MRVVRLFLISVIIALAALTVVPLIAAADIGGTTVALLAAVPAVDVSRELWALPLMVAYRDLAQLGVPFSRMHLYRLVRLRKFPAPLKPGLNRSVNCWLYTDIVAYVAKLAAERDDAQAAAERDDSGGSVDEFAAPAAVGSPPRRPAAQRPREQADQARDR